MERDVHYGRMVFAIAAELGQRVIEVDGLLGVDQVYDLVAEHLGFSDPHFQQASLD